MVEQWTLTGVCKCCPTAFSDYTVTQPFLLPSVKLVELEIVCIQKVGGSSCSLNFLFWMSCQPPLPARTPRRCGEWRRAKCISLMLCSSVLSLLAQSLLCILSLGKGRGKKKISFIVSPQGCNLSLEFSNLHLVLSAQLSGRGEGQSSNRKEWEQPRSFSIMMLHVPFPGCYCGLVSSQPNPPSWSWWPHS